MSDIIYIQSIDIVYVRTLSINTRMMLIKIRKAWLNLTRQNQFVCLSNCLSLDKSLQSSELFLSCFSSLPECSDLAAKEVIQTREYHHIISLWINFLHNYSTVRTYKMTSRIYPLVTAIFGFQLSFLM